MDRKRNREGMGLISALTLIFVVLKQFRLIDCSWLWVLSPIWISALLLTVVFSIILIGGRMKKGKW